MARERGAAVIHDNTWATGIFFRSFDHGADLVVQAATKYPGGHSDVLVGAVVASEAWWPRLRDASRDLGQTASPDDFFLALRGMRTLDVRPAPAREERAAGGAVARRAIPALRACCIRRCPRIPAMRCGGAISSARRGSSASSSSRARAPQLAALIDPLEFFALGYSWGGYESLIVPAKLAGARSVRPWTGGPLIRLHIGLEEPADLIADLERGFERMKDA